jgi:hypothetical protein
MIISIIVIIIIIIIIAFTSNIDNTNESVRT